MSREFEVATLLRADPLLTSILTGGIFTDEEIGVEGIRRGIAPDDTNPTKEAFDENGVLRPCAVVRQRGETNYQNIRMPNERMEAVGVVVQVFFYEFRGHVAIDIARQRVYELLFNTRLPGTYPLWRIAESPTFPDMGPVANSTVGIQDWQVVFLKRPVFA